MGKTWIFSVSRLNCKTMSTKQIVFSFVLMTEVIIEDCIFILRRNPSCRVTHWADQETVVHNSFWRFGTKKQIEHVSQCRIDELLINILIKMKTPNFLLCLWIS